MFACPLYNDKRESMLEPVHKNEVTNPLMSDTEKVPVLYVIETS